MGHICFVLHFHVLSHTNFRFFQDEDWSEAVPSLVTVVQDVVDHVKERSAKLKRKENVWRVLKQSGADLFWDDFPASFLADLNILGDGSRFFRAAMQKLKKAATSSPVFTPAQPKEQPKPYIRQVIKSSVPSSYMPNALIPVTVGSLLAVHLTQARCKELVLDKAFTKYIPLIAKVRRLIDAVTYECSWMESQKLGGHEECPDGLTDGYAGSWRDWILPTGEAAPTTILKASDVYACNFLLLPKTGQLCVPLRDFLKQGLAQQSASD